MEQRPPEKEKILSLHPSHQRQMRTTAITVALLALCVAVAEALPPLPGTRDIAGYLPLHTLLETIAVVIAMLVFAVGWNAYRRGLPGNILLLACAFFGVGVLDFTHMISFVGMPDFITPSSVDKSIDFWLSARSLAAIALFAVSVTPWRPLTSATSRYTLLATVLIMVGCLHWLFLFHDDLIPPTFIPGQGLTPLKIYYEYALVALNLAAALVLWLRMRKPLPFNASALFGAVCTMALSEYFLTLYSDATDIYNLLGHIYKIVSYFFLYRAIFVATIEHPYNQLHASQDQLQATLDAIPDLMFEVGQDGRFYNFHSNRADLLLMPPEAFLGKTIVEVLPPDAAKICMSALQEASEQGRSTGKEIVLPLSQGERWFELSVASKHESGEQDRRFIILSRDITERKRDQRLLEMMKFSIDHMGDKVTWVTSDAKVVYANITACNSLGYTMEEMLKLSIPDFDPDFPTEDWPAHWEELKKHGSFTFESRHRAKGGEIYPVEVSINYMRFDNEEYNCGYARDISKRKQAEDELRIAATAFESQESMMITDAEGVILRVNHAFTRTTGYATEEIIGQTPRLLKSGRHDADFYRDMWEAIHRSGTWQGEVWDRRKNGEVYPKWLTISAVKGDDGVITHYVGTHIEISERKAAEDEIKNLAFYDPLTRLPNRRLLMERLQLAVAASVQSGREGALLFIDLDHFKTLNDTLGHGIGDLLLQQVSHRLQSCVREGDTVARLGGDEFVVILENLSNQSIKATAQAEAIGEKFLTALYQPYQLGLHEYHGTPSIGVTLFNDHQLSMEELMKQADIAMYQAKKAGRNTMRFFAPQMQASIADRASLENELRKALAKQQFHLHYQVQVDDLYRPFGAEALIRWLHPERGMVSPAQFIPLAEETGLILPIGQWVLETACAQIKAWEQDALTRDLVLAVNVSSRQFHQADFVDQVHAVVQRHAINPTLLKLELTEGMLLENVESVIATMVALKAIGVRISLDDFGTGYSSLQYIKRLPLNQLKIDQSFVRELVSDSSDQAIVSTIIAMAQGLNLEVIAEGVEKVEQRQLLLDSGCNHYQGYLFGRPVPIELFEALLK